MVNGICEWWHMHLTLESSYLCVAKYIRHTPQKDNMDVGKACKGSLLFNGADVYLHIIDLPVIN